MKADLRAINAGEYGYTVAGTNAARDRIFLYQFDDNECIDAQLCMHISLARRILKDDVISAALLNNVESR